MLKGMILLAGVAGLATGALAQSSYGLLFEVSTDGSTWTRNLNVDVSGGAQSVYFRVSSFFTEGTSVTTADGTSNAVAFARFTGSNSLSNFGIGFNGDLVTQYQRDVPNGNAAFLQQSQSGSKRILGQAGTPLSFASQLLLTLPDSPVYMSQIASGRITIGNNNPGAMVRTIVFTNNTFGSGATPGLTFYREGSQQTAAPNNAGSPDFQFATIEVIPAPAATALLGLGGLVAARRRRA